MNKNTIGAVVALVVLAFVAYSYVDTNNTVDLATTVSSRLLVVEAPHDFGDIDIFGGKVRATYTLMNEGPEDVTVISAATSCMCTEGEIAGLTFGMHGSDVEEVVIPAGGTELVTAIYDPLAHGPNGVGPVTRELILETNSSETPKVTIRFSANVVKNVDN